MTKWTSTIVYVFSITACGGAASTSGGGGGPLDLPAHDLGPKLTEVLPAELPTTARCLGFAPTGKGALVVSPVSGEADDGSELHGVRVQFAMVKDAAAPLDLGTADFMTTDLDAWASRRAELEPQLVALGLVACSEVAHGYAVKIPHGTGELTIGELWEEVQAQYTEADLEEDADDDDHSVADRVGSILLTDRVGDHSTIHTLHMSGGPTGDHQKLESIYFNPWASALVIVDSNVRMGHASWEATAVDVGAAY